MSSDITPIIMWFRDDLRVSDNEALFEAASQGAVIPVYIHDETDKNIRKAGAASKWWLHHALCSLKHDLEKLNSTLLVFKGNSEDVLTQLSKETGARKVFWHKSYEIPTRKRDDILAKTLQAEGFQTKQFAGKLLFEPEMIRNGSGEPFKVFTPFWKHCVKQANDVSALLPVPKQLKLPPLSITGEAIESLQLLPKLDWDKGFYAQWQVSEKAAGDLLETFMQKHLQHYSKGRDFPASNHTSSLSPYLHFGQISPRQVWHSVRGYVESIAPEKQNAADKFLSEIGWREFCAHLLFHFPHMPTKPFKKEFDAFTWEKNQEWLEAWKIGKTGYPLVDAGMRQLWQTGVMHNRVRMVVASFLIKHLRINWQIGEAWFWDTLVDADYASNIASWQWVAGCGADAAPYFRIFNPILQSKKFDEEAAYIRHYVPELAKLPDDMIHTPWEVPPMLLLDAGLRLGKDYPHPIVEHAEARDKAMEAYKKMKIG